MIEVSVAREHVEEEEPPSSAWVTAVVTRTLEMADFSDPCEISVLLTNDRKIQELNNQYRHMDKATDVLSFAFEEDESFRSPPGEARILGDVVLSLPRLSEQAVTNRGTYPRECAWALAHGVLHLLGFDHQTDQEEDLMRGLEGKILAAFDEDFFKW